MPKLNKIPKQCNDRGRSFSWHEGKRIYHGVAGTPEANRNYNRFVHDLTKEPPSSPPDAGVGVGTAGASGVLVAELCDKFLKYAVKVKSPSDYSNYKTSCGGLLRYQAADYSAVLSKKTKDGAVHVAKQGYRQRSHFSLLCPLCPSWFNLPQRAHRVHKEYKA